MLVPFLNLKIFHFNTLLYVFNRTKLFLSIVLTNFDIDCFTFFRQTITIMRFILFYTHLIYDKSFIFIDFIINFSRYFCLFLFSSIVKRIFYFAIIYSMNIINHKKKKTKKNYFFQNSKVCILCKRFIYFKGI